MQNKIYKLLSEHALLAGIAMGAIEGVRHHDLPEDVKISLKETVEEIKQMHQDVMDTYWEDEVCDK